MRHFSCTPPQDLNTLGHVALGGVVGAALDFHAKAFLIGVDGSYRVAWPVKETPVTRDALWTIIRGSLTRDADFRYPV